MQQLLQQLSNFKPVFVLIGSSLIFLGIKMFLAGFLDIQNGKDKTLIITIIAFILLLIGITIISFSI